METKLIEVRDTKLRGMKDSLSVSPGGLRGHVEIYEKKNGKLNRLQENHNLIVFGGREWLLRRAFGLNLSDPSEITYGKTLSWFGVGTGGGEPGNPLQAGATKGNDKQLISQIALRAYNESELFKKMYCRKPEVAGGRQLDNRYYYKKFSSVVIKEDISNPYLDGEITKYPPIVAEVRIELSSQDACTNDEYTDLNEAALYVSTLRRDIDLGPSAVYDADDEKIICPVEIRSSSSSSSGDTGSPNLMIDTVSVNGNYITYYIKEENHHESFKNVLVNDLVYITSTNPDSKYTVPITNKAIIVDVQNKDTDPWSFTIEKPNDGDGTFTELLEAVISRGGYAPFTMFSRVTFSTIRKTPDREIVFLWKVYF